MAMFQVQSFKGSSPLFSFGLDKTGHPTGRLTVVNRLPGAVHVFKIFGFSMSQQVNNCDARIGKGPGGLPLRFRLSRRQRHVSPGCSNRTVFHLGY